MSTIAAYLSGGIDLRVTNWNSESSVSPLAGIVWRGRAVARFHGRVYSPINRTNIHIVSHIMGSTSSSQFESIQKRECVVFESHRENMHWTIKQNGARRDPAASAVFL